MKDSPLFQWQWLGWRPWTWKLRVSMETGCSTRADLGPFPAQVPGTVQRDLKEVGLLQDWHEGLHSLDCEWVEHRHWELFTKVPGDLFCGDRALELEAEGLDYWGWILVDGKEVASFQGALVPHRFNLKPYLTDGRDHFLSILFDCPPPEQGQIGFTSRSRYFKPRYNYGWDWCPRFVPVGVVGGLRFLRDLDAELSLDKVRSTVGEELDRGTLFVDLLYERGEKASLPLRLTLRDGEEAKATMQVDLVQGKNELVWKDLPVELWWPNGLGEAKTYTLVAEVEDREAGTWQRSRQVGFRRVRWLPCQDAPQEALPWLCEVNGEPVFLQGVNWSPVRVDYPDTTREEIEHLVHLYQQMGCTLFRVWGGAFLGTEVFYDLCDRAGILVWQEFPLSSSGVENAPPDSTSAIEELVRIARSYIARRAHHSSLLMWCGGNELIGGGTGDDTERPTPPDHPCLKALAQVVREEDPGRRFVHTSSTGRTFYAHQENFGKGLHHDVHGPWGWGERDMEKWRRYWTEDDALFRSEVGMPGASPVGLIKRFAGKHSPWPPTGPVWVHTSSWWVRPELYPEILALAEGKGLRTYVRVTRKEQAEAYAIAAKACKDRFPRCGGFLIWMGHDCYPCAMNNSVIDFEGKPKPAYTSLKKVFRRGMK